MVPILYRVDGDAPPSETSNARSVSDFYAFAEHHPILAVVLVFIAAAAVAQAFGSRE